MLAVVAVEGSRLRQEADGRYARVEEEEPGRLDDGFVIEDDDEDEQEIGHGRGGRGC